MAPNFRVGIIGGMGPAAGVLLQQLIIDATPAKKDQDHLQVICFTNPHIPDRTTGFFEGKDLDWVEAIIDSGKLLINAGATLLALPCNTAHMHIDKIQKALSVPLLDSIQLTIDFLRSSSEGEGQVAILATDATIAARIYQSADEKEEIEWIVPATDEQKQVMKSIYDIKAGKLQSGLQELLAVVDSLSGRGVKRMVLGCTELSLCYDELISAGYMPIDTLRLTAQHIVQTAQNSR